MKEDTGILLVEDDVVDVMAVKRAFKYLKVTNPLIVTANGEEALEYLRDEMNGKPGIILLDLDMPRMNGLEFLKVAKKDEALKNIPVIVLMTSKEEQDRINSLDLSVAGSMIKPVNYREFIEVVRTINLSWTIRESPEV